MKDPINHLDLADAAVDAWYRLEVAARLINDVLEEPKLSGGSTLTVARELIEGVITQLRKAVKGDGTAPIVSGIDPHPTRVQ
jgi:hypothetical protein